jgi:hypothetical protein
MPFAPVFVPSTHTFPPDAAIEYVVPAMTVGDAPTTTGLP